MACRAAGGDWPTILRAARSPPLPVQSNKKGDSMRKLSRFMQCARRFDLQHAVWLTHSSRAKRAWLSRTKAGLREAILHDTAATPVSPPPE